MVSGSENLIIMDKLLEARPEQVWELDTPGGLDPRGLPHLGDFYLQELCQELFIATSKEKSPHVCSLGRKIYFSEIYHNILSSTRPTLRRNYFPEPNLPGEGKCHNSGPPPAILSQPQGREEEPERTDEVHGPGAQAHLCPNHRTLQNTPLLPQCLLEHHNGTKLKINSWKRAGKIPKSLGSKQHASKQHINQRRNLKNMFFNTLN